MNGRMGKRKLTRLILAALMSTGGALLSDPSAEAATATPQERTGTGALIINASSLNTEGSVMGSTDYVFGNIQALPGPRYVISPLTDPSTVTGDKLDEYIKTYWNGEASNYMTTMTGGTLGYLYGGYSKMQSAIGNTVEIIGGTVNQVWGGYTMQGNAEDNNVTIASGANVTEIVGGEADPSGYGDAKGNSVTISGDTTNITGNVYGGKTGYGGGDATGNTVTISGGTVGTAEGWDGIKGGDASNGAANNNTVTISGGTINNDVWGGSGATADGNTVTISGDTIFQSSKGIHGAAAGTGDATNNTVNILTTQPLTLSYLYGGLNETGGTSSGNTLNLAAKDVTVGTLDKFQNMNFYLPSNVASGDTMLTVTGGTLNSKTDLQGVTFGVAALSGVSLAKNDTVNLITNPNGLTTDATLKTADSASLGTAEFLTANNLATDTKYTLGISKSGENTIIATVENVTEESGGGSGGGTTITAEDRLKSPVETRAAAVTLLNAGADMLASQGFAQAANAVALEAAEQAKSAEQGATAPVASTFTPFAAFGGSSMRAESGSHVDTKGFGINVGFAKEFPNSQGKLLFGPVVEYGGGKYDSYNNDIHGDGNSHYWGIGVMARQVNHDSFYYEGSVRFGRVTSDYGANYPAGRVSYDSASNYWAAHLGLGKVFATGKQDTVDAYLKYFYSHQGGDDTTIHIVGGNDEQASFDSVDSNRIRIGARYTHKVNEMNSFYGGLAYQYEFGGEARAHYAGLGEAPSPSVKGSSGMLELGWQVKPNNGPVTIDLGVTGWAGKQRGGSVQLGATWSF